jgi:hypothetical protein
VKPTIAVSNSNWQRECLVHKERVAREPEAQVCTGAGGKSPTPVGRAKTPSLPNSSLRGVAMLGKSRRIP